MPIGILFWVLMILWFIFGILNVFNPNPYLGYANTGLLFVLFALLGWKVFGPALRA